MPELSHSPPVQSQSVLTRVRAEFNSHRASLTLLVIFLLTAWLAFSWFETIHRILRYYNPLPTWDYWRVAESIQSYESFDFRILWRQHNEHRIIFPEIVFAADMLFLHGRELLPLALSFLCYFATWIVLAWAFWSESADPSGRPNYRHFASWHHNWLARKRGRFSESILVPVDSAGSCRPDVACFLELP